MNVVPRRSSSSSNPAQMMVQPPGATTLPLRAGETGRKPVASNLNLISSSV